MKAGDAYDRRKNWPAAQVHQRTRGGVLPARSAGEETLRAGFMQLVADVVLPVALMRTNPACRSHATGLSAWTRSPMLRVGEKIHLTRQLSENRSRAGRTVVEMSGLRVERR
jgi:hypothetical protein